MKRKWLLLAFLLTFTLPAAALCGLGVLVFGFGVLGIRLTGKIERTGRDLELYRAGTPALYAGPLLLVDRPVRDGAKQIPDERYVYYRSATAGDPQCAVTLIAQTQLMQPSYRVEYLPETGTILSITDMAGRLRTGGKDMELAAPAGCWLYGDLAVPICDEVEGYDALTREQKALFDLLYSQVLSGDVAAGNLPTRSFDLPYPPEKAEEHRGKHGGECVLEWKRKFGRRRAGRGVWEIGGDGPQKAQ